ncbi:MAG: DUF748 domain-containing protein [Halioglobus sp.]|nr:DUF748 domain-containing protein [Halioglobus sp.]
MRTFLRVVAITYLVYLAIALLLISPALNLLPHKYLKDNYGRELQTGWVLLNPFTLSLDISEAQLSDNTGERFVGFSEASIDLSLESLWQPGWVLDTVRIRDLYVEVTRLNEDEYNFSDFLSAGTAPEEPVADEDASLPGITIRNLELHSEAIVLTDAAVETAYVSRWNGLHIQVENISTVFEDGRPFSVDVEAADGGKLQWTGEISLPLGQSTGRLSLSELNLHKLWVYAEPWLAFELKEGQLLVDAEYELNWNDELSYRVSNGHVALSGLDIAPKTPGQLADTAVSMKTLDIDNITVDSATQKVALNAVTLDTLAVAGWMEESRISLQELFAVDLPADSGDKEESADAAPWTVALNKAQLRNSSVRWRSEFTDPQVLDIKPLEASLEQLNWPLSGDTKMSLSLSINEQAHINVTGNLALEPGNGSIDYSLEGLPLTWFNPNLPSALKAKVTGGNVAVQGKVALQEYAPTTIALEGSIREFSARREGAEVRLTGFDLLRLDGLAVDMTEHSVVLEQLTINAYTGRIHIHEDGSINASKVWQEEVGEEAQQIAEDLTADKPWTFSLPTIQISDSSIDFMDESLPIQFRTVIGDLQGEVLNLSSDPAVAATIDLKGSVDGYAPVTLSGEVTPLADPTNLDLTLVFDGVDMALLSPYSGTYAGYVIERGLLDLNLHYALKDNQLQGDNAIRVEKLKLGEKISSDKAVDLPLELALAILTDSNGVIDMAVPVKGDVNNPGFDLSGVISDAILNLLTKAITAPFSLLANLVSTEDDLQRITFSSGSSTLSDRSKEKLNELASALSQRPQLSLVVTGRLNKDADRERLQRKTLKTLLLERGLSEEDIKAKNPQWEEEIAVLYADLPTQGGEPSALTAREQYESVESSITIPDEQMMALAGERAVAVKLYLVSEAGLAPERAVVAQANLKDSDNEFSGVELGIGD